MKKHKVGNDINKKLTPKHFNIIEVNFEEKANWMDIVVYLIAILSVTTVIFWAIAGTLQLI